MKLFLPKMLFLFAILLFHLVVAAQPGKEQLTIENYYKVKWGFADEFIHLWKVNHYPLLKKAKKFPG